jgi:hypothetical protein
MDGNSSMTCSLCKENTYKKYNIEWGGFYCSKCNEWITPKCPPFTMGEVPYAKCKCNDRPNKPLGDE